MCCVCLLGLYNRDTYNTEHRKANDGNPQSELMHGLSVACALQLASLSNYTALAIYSCGAVYCNRSCLLWVCDSGRAVYVTTITRNCVHRSSPNWVCRCRQRPSISSWLNFGGPAPPGRGSASGRKFLAPRYYGQRAVFASLRALFH